MRARVLAGLALGTAALCASADAPTLYEQLGAQPGLARLVDDLVQRASTDPRIARQFEHTNLKELRLQLTAQLCALSGGPCRYEGGAMKPVHADMGIDATQFNALVEDLQAAMDAAQVPFSVQNRLLALLAPLHREIITR